jgi:tetraacyldisaccharide 4'-kinase
MTWRIDRHLYEEETPWWKEALLLPLYLFSIPYGWAVRARAFFYARGFLRTKRLPCPVISVGNITVGGTGKTPLVAALAKGLMERGVPTAVLSRGYRRSKGTGCVVSDGRSVRLSPEESGDEPYLMGRNLPGIPVLVGKSRFISGRKALQDFQIRGLILDDGYQHLSLHRDLNIVLIDSQAGLGNRSLLPRGSLREPPNCLRRAHLILLTKVEHPEDCHSLEALVRAIHPSPGIFHSRYEPLDLIGLKGETEGIESLRGKRVFAFSGVARPESFAFLLRKLGAKIVREVFFEDHHAYTNEDLRWIEKEARGVDRVVTTEKDMVKLQTLQNGGPSVWALRIEMKLWEEEEFFAKVMEVFLNRAT